MVDESLVVFADDVDSEYLTESDKKMKVRSEVDVSSDWSSYGALLRPSGLSYPPLMEVLLVHLTSLMKIYAQTLNIPSKK